MSEDGGLSAVGRRERAVLGGGVLAWAIGMLAFKLHNGGYGALSMTQDALTGGALLATGVWALGARADRRIGRILLLASFLWFTEDLATAHWQGPTNFFAFASTASPIGLAYLGLAFPSGRLSGLRARRLLIALAVLLLLVIPLHDYLNDELKPRGFGGSLPEQLWASGAWAALGLVGIGIALLLVSRRRHATKPTRRFIDPFLLAALALVAVNVTDVAVHASASLSDAAYRSVQDVLVTTEDALTLALVLAFPLGLLLLRLARGAVTARVLREAGERRDGDLQSGLARALEDPDLRLLLWDADRAEYRDERSDAAPAPTAAPGRALAPLTAGGEHVGVVDLDETWAEDPQLLDALGRVVALSLENRDLHDSRAALVQAADRERRQLERDLHDGAQQRLVSVALMLGALRDAPGEGDLDERLAAAERELRAAIDDVRGLARGARPSPLLLHGLAGAVRELVGSSPLEIEVSGEPRRSASEHEAAAYFVVCEALANIGRHADAVNCRIELAERDGRLELRVEDDGRGGAALRPGGGLQGLRHRVEALGGKLELRERPGGGTIIYAELPWPATPVAETTRHRDHRRPAARTRSAPHGPQRPAH